MVPAAPPAQSGEPAGPRRKVDLFGVDVTGIGYDRGDPRAPVVIVDFSDFGCPFCGQFERETYPPLAREFVATGKVYFKYVPFVMGMFPNGSEAARAAECAAEQGKFWEMHDRLYATQPVWKSSDAPATLFERDAAAIGIDTRRYASCYTEGRGDARTTAANEAAHRLGIRATPTFFVNGRQIEGALPLPQFRMVIEQALR